MWLAEGQTVTVTATMNQFGAVLMYQNGTPVADKPITTKGGTTSFTYTSPATRNYSLHMISDLAGLDPITYSVSIK